MFRIIYTAIPETGPDYREFDVITPHPTAARALRAPSRSLQRLARAVVEKHEFRVAGTLTARRLLVQAVATVRERSTDGPAEFDALATRLLPMLATALRTGIDLEKLREFGSPHAAELAEVAKTYRNLLRAQHLIDNVELLLFASSLEFPPSRLYVHGYFRARVQEIAFINAACGDGSVLVLPTFDHAMFRVNQAALEAFRVAGWTVEEPREPARTVGTKWAERFRGQRIDDPPAGSAWMAADIEAEVRAALGQIKTLLQLETPAAEIVLVTRDPAQYGPALSAVADEYQIPLRRSYKIPLAETRLGGWLSLLLEAGREDLPFEPTLRFVAHPLGAGLNGDNWREARTAHTYGAEKWTQIVAGLSAFDWPERATRSQWWESFREGLFKLRIRELCADSARDLNALDQLETEVTNEFRGLATLLKSEFVDEIASILKLLTVPVAPGAGGIELHEPTKLTGARYQHLFVLGAVDGILPKQAEDNPVIDFFERRQLGQHGVEFESAAEVARWEDLDFHFLLEASEGEVWISYPQMIDGKSRLPSAYFGRLDLPVKPLPLAAPAVFSQSELLARALRAGVGEDDILKAARRSYAIEVSRESAGRYDEFDGVTGVEGDATARTWSASQLLNLGQCPFRWFAEKALRVRPAEEPSLGLAADVRGRLYHKAFELALSGVPDGVDLREWALRELDRCFGEAEQDVEVALPQNLPAWSAQRLEHLDILRGSIRSEDFLLPNSSVVAREVKFIAPWHGLRVLGYIDRVDQTPEGLMLIDYKTGGKPKGIKNRGGMLEVDLQVPIYIEAAAPSLYPNQPVAGGYYYSISRAKILAEVEPDAVPELAEFAASVHTRLRAGYFPVEPDAKQEACKYCNFTSVCRRGHRLTRKTTS